MAAPAALMKREHYAELAAALGREQCNVPVLLLDRDRLDSNLETLAKQQLPSLRLVVKSLPSLDLLDYCMAALDTRRLMSFHRPFLQQLLARYDNVDILMGKPLPVSAVRQVLDQSPRERLAQVQWLVDSEARLQELLALAKEHKLRLRVNAEINVGMQRGGLDEPARLARLEKNVLAESGHLQLTGLMGYDAHAAKAGTLFRSIAGAIGDSQARYRRFIDALVSDHSQLNFNGAGSPTHTHHTVASPLNDVSLGSVLVKPTDFDLPDLRAYMPALWIATPVLKRQAGVTIPFLETVSRSLSRIGPWARDSVFVYGGRWMAQPAWPQGMKTSSLYGLSSNQQLMTVPAGCELTTDDWVFFRPTQSEAVMLQFGDIRVLSGGNIVARWPTLQND